MTDDDIISLTSSPPTLLENEREITIARLTADNERLRAALAAIEKLALQASISSCTCLTKTPDITFHNPGCRYVLLQYIVAQCEDARAALTQEPRA